MRLITNKKNEKEFMKMIAWIELCGSIGHTCDCFQVSVDGDGSGRLKFEFDTKEEQIKFDEIKKNILAEYDKTRKDLKRISFE